MSGDEADGWVVLTGDQAGSLLGASTLDWTAGGAEAAGRLVATTIVSSTLLSKVAAAAGAQYAETLTGFKWIARAADGVPGARFVFGYEEALGYAVGDVVRDKDGIGAALAMLAVAAEAKAAGRSVLDRYDELERAHGVHLTSQVTLRTADQARVMRLLRADPPAELGGQPVTALGGPGWRRRQRAAEGGRADLPAGRRPGGAAPERHRAENQVLHRGGGAAGRAVAAGRPAVGGRAARSAAARAGGHAGRGVTARLRRAPGRRVSRRSGRAPG